MKKDGHSLQKELNFLIKEIYFIPEELVLILYYFILQVNMKEPMK